MHSHSRAPKKNTSHGNEVLPQDITHFIQRPCYQRGSPCQTPAGNRTTQRPPDHCKETLTAVAWSCLLFIRSGKTHLARHSEGGKKTRQTEEEVGRQHQGKNRREFAKSQRTVENRIMMIMMVMMITPSSDLCSHPDGAHCRGVTPISLWLSTKYRYMIITGTVHSKAHNSSSKSPVMGSCGRRN